MTTHEHDDPQSDPVAEAEVRPAAEEQLREAQDRLLRAQAELENFRKRAQRELADERRYGEMGLLRDILPVLDNVLRAVEAAEKKADAESLLAGFRMTAQQIEKLLESHGCHTIVTDGAPFDPNVHEAILQQPSAGVAPGTILATTTRGYTLHDRVVRPSQVIVAKGD